jgi:hypothetical protein
MALQIFGAQAAAIQLFEAYFGVAPSNPIFVNNVATINASSSLALSNQIAAQFAGLSDAAFTAKVLANVNINSFTVNATALAALTQGMTDAFTAFGPSARGQIVLNVVTLLSNLEGNATYGAAAAAYNTTVTSAFTFASNTTNTTTGTVTSGLNLTLTSGVDFATGGAGNDTIIADNTGANKQLSVADTINGGDGFDTLKVFLAAADATTGQPTLTSIESVFINGGAVTAYTAATGTTNLTIDTPAANTAGVFVVNGQSVTLSNIVPTASTTTATINQAATSTATALSLTLNNVTAGTGVVNTVDIGGANIATLNLDSNTLASKITLGNTGAGIRTINFTGSVGVTEKLSAGLAGAVTTINGSTATGALNVDTSNATVAGSFKFTGGSANDTITFANNALGTLISGAQLDGGAGTGDKIGIFDADAGGVAGLTATETARINQAVNFEVLGLNGSLTLDASTLTSIKSFSIDTTALTTVINSMATGSTVTTAVAAPTSITLGTAVGVTDVSIVLGSATSTGTTVGTLVTTGITNVSLTSNGLAANAVTTLTNSDNSVFTLKGATDLTLSLSAGTAVGSKIDGSAATGKLTLTGSSITTSGDIIIGGSANDTINGGKGADTLTGGAGQDLFSFTATTGANASGGTFGQPDVITDFVIGTDKLQFAGVTDIVSAQQGAVQNAVTALAAGSSATAIATAMATANTTSLGVSFAVFEGNTYVLYETTGASTGVAADDVFIKLTGVATLPTFAADVTP